MFKSGKYYVGDLCCVINRSWEELYSLLRKKPIGGEFTLSNKIKVGLFFTKLGDGYYCDGEGNDYKVESGTIGCVLISDILINETPNIANGAVIYFKENFDIDDSEGVLVFGEVEIDTGDF